MKTVYLATLENSSQASILQSALINEGIESFLRNEILSTVINTPGFQIEIEVLEEDYEKALEVLKNGFPYLVDGE
ncbi:putative signal transducing protein [Massilibacteroides vaginae]|uniref:putative signal transducing protein n=1 Tax=Massilibacteroides vaginae TaxID=1673718 RepID=UPI000A1CDD1E|nr:DUF2007 domain-containing protein [Massilibacteroides vaginae]